MKTNPAAYCRGLADDPQATPEQIDELKAQVVPAFEGIAFTTSYEEAARDADLIIEAIAEDPQQKIALMIRSASRAASS